MRLTKPADERLIPVPDDPIEREKALRKFLKDVVDKKYGKNTVFNLNDGAEKLDIDRVPTGSLHLDEAIGGGIPRGLITEVFGAESGGKTTLLNSIISQAQRLGLRCAFIDVEQTADFGYMVACGVDPRSLEFSQPNSAEEALNIVEDLVRSGFYGIIALDSIAALAPQDEVEAEMGELKVGLLARLLGQAMRKLTAPARRTNTGLVFTNQIREKVGVMYGNPITTPGGHAMLHHASLRLHVRKGEVTKVGDRPDHVVAKITVVKSKISTPGTTVEADIFYGRGISRTGGIISLGVEKGVLQRAGAYYRYKGENIGQGREAAIRALDENPSLADQIEAEIRHTKAQTAAAPEEDY